MLYGPRDVRFEERPDPKIIEPTDAIIRTAAACVCGPDLWPYGGIEPIDGPTPMGHEYVGIVEEVGSAVETIEPGQFVVGSFWASDNTCEICRAGYQSRCVDARLMGPEGAQAPLLRAPLADGTLVATPDIPSDDLIPSLLAASDVLGTGRIIAMSRHEDRQKLALEFGASEIVTERGEEGAAKIKELTGGLGAHSVVEAVGTQESMMQAIRSTRAGGHVGFVGVLHDVEIPGEEFFFSHVHLPGGSAPVRRFLPELIDLIWNRKIDPGKVFDLELPLDEAADGYRAMDQRDANKGVLRPQRRAL